MIEDWKPQWTANDIRTVGIPLVFLVSYVFGFYFMRQCADMVNTVPWNSTILIGPIMGAFGVGFAVNYLYQMFINGIFLVFKELDV
ncbi:MAG: hypothetical protein PHN69_07295 [Candidatus Pacebacteria bacterium]|nr:hypothetical protein [Fermentimonas sp.]MDD4804929.1 hypothetical protein [Candidatus Paceibacterota bacterium]